MKKILATKNIFLSLAPILLWFGFFGMPNTTHSADFSVTPETGKYSVGSTFDISVVIDTKGQTVNALSLIMSFPPDKLQVVSPTVGNSILGIYTTAPKYDNQAGRIEIVGGIHNGIATSNGLVARLTFRVKSQGTANLRILGNSQVLLNDGKGTDVLDDINNAVYTLDLDSENGPVVSFEESETKNNWFFDSVLTINWLQPLGATGFSYVLSERQDDLPDDVIDSKDSLVVYKSMKSGTYYFHIKALVGNNWGPTSHTLVQIDNEPPKPFEIKVWPGVVTSNQRPQFSFRTTDEHSGINRYEVKIINLEEVNANQQSFFIPTTEEFIPELMAYGKYDVVVRAYDKAGNITESVQRVIISNSPTRFLASTGIFFRNNTILPWYFVFSASTLAFFVMLVLGWLVRRRYKLFLEVLHHDLMDKDTKEQLNELEKYRVKYGKLAAVLLIALISGLPFMQAQARVSDYAAPQILSYPKVINHDEIFYISGRAADPSTEVLVHVQGVEDKLVYEYTVLADERGDWFYQHDGLLDTGKYSVWATARKDNQVSPPGAQIEVEVRSVAFLLGGTKISYQNIYFVSIIVLLAVSLTLVGFIIYYLVHHGRRRKYLLAELSKVEESIRYGFIQLRHDLAAELALIKSKHNGKLDGETELRANQLQEDISHVEQIVGQGMDELKTSS